MFGVRQKKLNVIGSDYLTSLAVNWSIFQVLIA